MKFSVVVPVYNAELYLNRLVKSVLDQTFSDFELILVDDGSTDNSFALMKNYKRKILELRFFQKRIRDQDIQENTDLKSLQENCSSLWIVMIGLRPLMCLEKSMICLKKMKI